MNPVLKYPGSKWRAAQWIIGNMPPHESYVEPFAGSLAVLFNKHPARIETVNDVDGEVVNFFRVCREQPDELAEAISLTPWARDEFTAACKKAEHSPVERARCFAVRCWMAFGSLANGVSWRSSTGSKENGGPDNPKLWNRVPAAVHQAAVRLKEVQIENRPALEVIRCFDGPRTLIYADPPYVTATRTAHRDQYHHEMTDADHSALLETLNACRGMVLLSGYDCELYRNMLSGWEVLTTRVRAERGAIRTECLWLNPTVQQALGSQLKISGF